MEVVKGRDEEQEAVETEDHGGDDDGGVYLRQLRRRTGT